jgi:site-specific recombinase XerD
MPCMMTITMTLSKDRVTILVDDYKKYLLTDKHLDTVRGYVTDIKDYLGWCENRGADIGPVNDYHLLQYCRYLLDDRNCDVTTVAKKIKAVRRYYCYLGYDY